MLKPYSATFVSPHAETVVPMGAEFSSGDWWKALVNRSPANGPRSISELLRADAGQSFALLALSEPYARALADDIRNAAKEFKGQVGLVSVGLGAAAGRVGLSDIALPVKAKLKTAVGGAMQGVNARIAHRIVGATSSWFPEWNRLESLIRCWVDEAAPLPKFSRRQMSDDDVRHFIRANLNANRRATKTGLLRRLRSEGNACEQNRFGRIFAELELAPRCLLGEAS